MFRLLSLVNNQWWGKLLTLKGIGDKYMNMDITMSSLNCYWLLHNNVRINRLDQDG